MNPEDKAAVMNLARELECAAWLQAPAPRSASGWLIGQACRAEWHRRAVRFTERLMRAYAW